MQGRILLTDHNWFEYLRGHGPFDEVNFWRPKATGAPRIDPGTPILFKLHKAQAGRIVGFGSYARHDVVPVWLAWEIFETGNGAPNLTEMRAQIEEYRRKAGVSEPARAGDYSIGCQILTQPVFLPPTASVRPPSDWHDAVQVGKSYDLSQGEGARVWHEVLAASGLEHSGASVSGPTAGVAAGPRYGDLTMTKPRLGQGTFRLAVTAAYDRACAVTREHSLPALEAAHIRPFAEDGTHDVSNGLLLRSDIHRLFDKGYVGVTPEYRFAVSKALKDDFENGKSYYPLHGREIWLPENVAERPNAEMLEWHLGERFRG